MIIDVLFPVDLVYADLNCVIRPLLFLSLLDLIGVIEKLLDHLILEIAFLALFEPLDLRFSCLGLLVFLPPLQREHR